MQQHNVTVEQLAHRLNVVNNHLTIALADAGDANWILQLTQQENEELKKQIEELKAENVSEAQDN